MQLYRSSFEKQSKTYPICFLQKFYKIFCKCPAGVDQKWEGEKNFEKNQKTPISWRSLPIFSSRLSLTLTLQRNKVLPWKSTIWPLPQRRSDLIQRSLVAILDAKLSLAQDSDSHEMIVTRHPLSHDKRLLVKEKNTRTSREGPIARFFDPRAVILSVTDGHTHNLTTVTCLENPAEPGQNRLWKNHPPGNAHMWTS